jgi:hypothetical protein
MSASLSLLSRARTALEKYGIEGEELDPRWNKTKNYLSVVNIFTELSKKEASLNPQNIESKKQVKHIKEKFKTLLSPLDVKRTKQLIESISSKGNTLTTSQETLEIDPDSKPLSVDSSVDLYFALESNRTKLLAPSDWLYSNDSQCIELLSELIQRGVHICFGQISPEMLQSRAMTGKNYLNGKSYTEYLSDDVVPDWWEKAFFGSKAAGMTKEELICLLKKRLAEDHIPENQWDDFILTAKNHQLFGLLCKDRYYLGWLDPAAKHKTLETIHDLFAILDEPAKFNSLAMSYSYGFTPLPSRVCIGLRTLNIGHIKIDLRTLDKFIHLEMLSFDSFSKQESLQELPLLHKLMTLRIAKGSLSQRELEKICVQPKLEVLQLDECSLRNIDLSFLLELTKLKELSVPKNIYNSTAKGVKDVLSFLRNKEVLITTVKTDFSRSSYFPGG